jgi:hypothetical protein
MKYTQGYIILPVHGIIPKPSSAWPAQYQACILPLFLVFSVAWALEIVSHLEELVFWLFLIHSSDTQKSWFKTWHFGFWAFGSLLALGGLPAVTVLTRNDPIKCEAYTFLAGSAGSLLLTILFLPVLFMFPRFLRKVKGEGAEPSVVVRLHKFHQLNITRIIFRFFFVAPLLVLAVDGVQDHNDINENPFWTDLLTVVAAVGCTVSSMITLLIFFPRSHELEAGYRFRMKDEEADIDDALSSYDESYPDAYPPMQGRPSSAYPGAVTVPMTDSKTAVRPGYDGNNRAYSEESVKAHTIGHGNGDFLQQDPNQRGRAAHPPAWDVVDYVDQASDMQTPRTSERGGRPKNRPPLHPTSDKRTTLLSQRLGGRF